MVQQDSINVDVIVVGSGGAGLAAALDAMDRGATVAIIERESELGGATAISGGGCFASATPVQAERGIEDTTGLALADWLRWGQGSADEEWARFYIESTSEHVIGWLADLGVNWDAVNQQEGNTVPRWHHPEGGGKQLWQVMYDASLASGVDHWLTNTAATELIVKSGRVLVCASRTVTHRRNRNFMAKPWSWPPAASCPTWIWSAATAQTCVP